MIEIRFDWKESFDKSASHELKKPFAVYLSVMNARISNNNLILAVNYYVYVCILAFGKL